MSLDYQREGKRADNMLNSLDIIVIKIMELDYWPNDVRSFRALEQLHPLKLKPYVSYFRFHTT